MLETQARAAPPPRRRERHRPGGGDDEAGPDELVSGRAILGVLQRRKWSFLACALLIPALAFVALHQVTPLYTASGTLLYEPSQYKARELQSILQVDRVTQAVMASQAATLRGLRIVEPMAQRLHLFSNPEFNPRLRPPSLLARLWHRLRGRAMHRRGPAPFGPTADPSRDAVLLAVQAAITVRPINASHVLRVTFTAADPVLAAAGVNLLMDIYIKGQLGAKYRAVHRARDWLEKRAAALRRQVRAAEDRIAAYRAREGLVRGVHAGLETEQISHLTEDLARARGALANAQGRLDAARGGGGAAAQAAVAPSVVALRAQRDAIAAQLQSLLTRLGPNHPDVIALRRQLAQVARQAKAETARVVAASEAEVQADRQRVAALEADLARTQAKVERDAKAQIPLNAMERDADAARRLLDTVLERIQETAQQAAVETPDAHEVSTALPPQAPSWPRSRAMFAAAVAFGLLFGAFVIYLQELADTSLASGEEVRNALRLPCFALIPEVTRRALGRLRVEDYAALKPLTPFAEQVRSLRAGLWLGANRPRTIAITAARPAEGKTTAALALGRLAAMSGERVVLLDCDLRRPSLGRLLGAEGRPGIAECLQGSATLDAVVRNDPLTSMAYIPAGAAGADAIGLFLSEAMGRTVQVLRERYDLVLLDAPPAHAMADARVIAQMADATVLCVRWRSTPRAVVQSAIDLLEESQASIAGVTLTRVDPRAHARSGYPDAEACHPRYRAYFQQ